jgi:proline dehydrogenase
LRALIPLIPDFLVKTFAKPYVAGDSLERGVEVTKTLLEEHGILTSLDMLAEETRTDQEVADFLRIYLRMVDACAAFPDPATRPSVSIKPSSFTTAPLNGSGHSEAESSRMAIFEIARHARDRAVPLTVDMEDRHWTDWTLKVMRNLRGEGFTDIGTVVQTRLNRTEEDLKTLPEGMRIRLVIGIYIEPREVAILDKKEMKERMLRAADSLLRRGHYVEFATHDESYVRRFLEEVVPGTGAGTDRFEIQMIYGVPRLKFQKDLVAGKIGPQGPVQMRVYVPFATSWDHAIAYCRRRLIENPSMASAVAGNLGRILLRRK